MSINEMKKKKKKKKRKKGKPRWKPEMTMTRMPATFLLFLASRTTAINTSLHAQLRRIYLSGAM